MVIDNKIDKTYATRLLGTHCNETGLQTLFFFKEALSVFRVKV